MPFGPYKDFDDCTSKNQDKDSPEGYCAAVHKKVTGKFPTENSEQMEGSKLVINLSEAEFQDLIEDYKEPNIQTYFQDTPARAIRGVEIFKVGKHQDSLGREREWTSSELGSIIKAFSSGRPSMVPVKLGHTSAEHNEKVAKELGIPPSILSGEGSNGHGAANLGHVTKVYRSNGTLIADLEVPEKVAVLVKSGLFANVSSELNENYQDLGPAISGLALLGSERPALKGLKGLSEAQILAEEQNPNLVYVFSMGSKLTFTDRSSELEFVKDREKKHKPRKVSDKYMASVVDNLHEFVSVPSKRSFLRRKLLGWLDTGIDELEREIEENPDLTPEEKASILARRHGKFFVKHVDDLNSYSVGDRARRLALKKIPSKDEVLAFLKREAPDLVDFVKTNWRNLSTIGLIALLSINRSRALREIAKAKEQELRSRGLAGPVAIEGKGRVFSGYVDKLHHFIFRSGRARANPVLIYQVPVTESTKDDNGQTAKRTIVQHVRASSLSEARGVAFAALQSVLSGFGSVVAAGAGALVVTLIAERLGFIPRIRYDVGNPTIVNNPTTGEKRKAKNPVKSLIRVIGGDKFRIFQDYAGRVDSLHQYNLLSGLQLGTAVVAKLPLMVIGAVTLKNVAFDVIARDKESKQERPVRVWVEQESQVEPKVKETLGPDWGLVGKVTAAVIGRVVGDQARLGALGFGEQSDLLHSFVSLKVTKTSTQKGASEQFVNYSLQDQSTGTEIGTAMVTFFPEFKELVVDWIQGNIGIDGVRQFLHQLKVDFPSVTRVLGDRASGANPGRILAMPLGRFDELVDGLHEFHKVNWITRRPVKRHKHGGKVSGAIGTTREVLKSKRARRIGKGAARLAIRRRFMELEAGRLREVSDAISG